MKILPLSAFAFVSFIAVGDAHAGPGEVWTYDKLKQDADLVVIATPLGTKASGETENLSGIQFLDANGVKRPVAVIGLNTSFSVLTVLKGELTVPVLVLHHARETEPVAKAAPGAPMLVAFNTEKNSRYLMFLKKDKDGRYVAVSGQTDPAIAIKDIGPGL